MMLVRLRVRFHERPLDTHILYKPCVGQSSSAGLDVDWTEQELATHVYGIYAA